MRLAIGNHFVEVQEQIANAHPCGQERWVDICGSGEYSDAGQFLGCFGIFLERLELFGQNPGENSQLF